MKHILEGYRWMWGAIRRWRGGALWRRTILFLLYVLCDAFGSRRRAAGLLGVLGVMGLAVLLLPGDRSESPFHVDIGISAEGYVSVDGRTMAISELEGALQGHRFQTVGIEVEGDAASGLVWQVNDIIVDQRITLARFDLVESID